MAASFTVAVTVTPAASVPLAVLMSVPAAALVVFSFTVTPAAAVSVSVPFTVAVTSAAA